MGKITRNSHSFQSLQSTIQGIVKRENFFLQCFNLWSQANLVFNLQKLTFIVSIGGITDYFVLVYIWVWESDGNKSTDSVNEPFDFYLALVQY